MGLASLVSYLSGALGYSLLFSGAILLIVHFLGRRLKWRGGTLLLSTSFVIFLAVSPFPDPQALNCVDGGVAIQTTLFSFLEAPVRLWNTGAPLHKWLTDLTITSTIMNVVFFSIVGITLATQTKNLGTAFLFGVALTLGIETLQFTGLLGVYPCRYRTVDVDDLMLNVVGVVLGFVIARRGSGLVLKNGLL